MRTALQRCLALPLNPPPPPPDDPWGDSLQNVGEHTYRHDGPKDKWYDALVAAYGSVLTAIDPADGTHESYSPGYHPDLVALHHAPDGIHHLLADVKVGNPFLKSLTLQDAPRAAAVAFAHTEEHFMENVLGRAAFTRGQAAALFFLCGSRVPRRVRYTTGWKMCIVHWIVN